MENLLEESYKEEIARLLTQANELIQKAKVLSKQNNLSLYYTFQAECDNLASLLRDDNIIDYNNDGWNSSETCW